MWTSMNNSPFLTVTAHFWCQQEEVLSTKTIDCFQVDGRNIAERIAEEAKKVLEDFSILPKVLTSVTDNGSNIVKAMKDLQLCRIPCFAHTLHLAVSDTIKALPALKEVKEKASKVVALTKRRSQADQKLQEYQKNLGKPKPKKLLQDVPTCWNSFFLMLERLKDEKDAVSLLLSQAGMDDGIDFLSSNLLGSIEDAVEMLHPCYQATEEFSGERFSTGSKVIPMTKMLLGFYAKADRNAPPGSFKKQLAGDFFNLNKCLLIHPN